MRKFPLLMIPALMCLTFAQTQSTNENAQQPPTKRPPKKEKKRKRDDGSPIQVTDPGAILNTSAAHSLKITLPHQTGGNGHGSDDTNYKVNHIECLDHGTPVRHPSSGTLPRFWALAVTDITGTKSVFLLASILGGGHRVDVQEGPGVTCQSIGGGLNCANFQIASTMLFYIDKRGVHLEPVSGTAANCTGEVDIKYRDN